MKKTRLLKKTRLRAAPALVGVIASVVALAPVPALGARISECAIISNPGSYTLTRNLTAVGDCLVVAADFVTLDLGGWVITGDGSTGSGIIDQGDSRRGIVVRNGTVTGFDFAVDLGTTSGAVVERVRAIDNFTGALAPAAAAPSAAAPSAASPTGMVVSASRVGPGSTVSGNTVRGEQFTDAVSIVVTCPSNVIGNTATDSGQNLVLRGEGCTNIDNLAPEGAPVPPEIASLPAAR